MAARPDRARSVPGRGNTAAAAILAMLSLSAAPAFAQESWLSDHVDLRGVATFETAIETDGDGLQKTDFVLEPSGDIDLGTLGRLTFIGRLRADPVDELEPGRPSGQEAFRSPVSRRGFVGDSVDAELREFYLDAGFDNVFLRLGKQQVVWGEADGLRVLDAINPLQYREFILDDFEDRRIPLWMANVEATFGNVTAQFLWIPDHTYDETPEPGATYEITSPRFVPAPPPGFAGDIAIEAADRPGRFGKDDDYGARVNAFLGGWDLSFNYLYHYQDAPVLRRTIDAAGDATVTPSYERTHLVGATASNAFGKFTLRTEVGYSTDRYVLTVDPTDADGVFETSELSYVLGLDYQHDGDTFISGQVFQSVLIDAARGAGRDDVDTTFSLLASREFRNDTIVAEAFWLQSLNDGDGLLQFDLSYEIRSNLTAVIGADIFFGDEDGVFGQFDQTDRILFGLEYGF